MRFLLFLLLCSTAAANTRDPRAWPTVCRVIVPGYGGSSVGSGCCVYSQASPPISYVLTAAHVVSNGGAPICRFPDGQQYRCGISYRNRRQDVAVLWFQAARPHYTALADRPPRRGELVTLVGYGGQRPYFLAYSGQVTGAVGSGAGWRDTIEAYTPPVSQGDSGCPVLLSGRVCGVLSAKDDRGHSISPAVVYQIKASFQIKAPRNSNFVGGFGP